MLACYTDRLSARPAERFALHAGASAGPCVLEIARVGAGREVVLRREGIAVGDHPTPPNADRDGCGWPAALEIEVGDWTSGYYDVQLTDAVGEETHHFVVVKPPIGQRRAKAAFVLATNTYHAYNHWGGANAYCDVAALMSRRADLPTAMAGAIGLLSTRRPFPQMLIAPPPDVPRLVNLRARGFEERPWAGNRDWPRRRELSPYDSSAGFLHRWEHKFAAWAEREGLALDYFTDQDLDEEDVLAGYDVLILAGHSEYWTARQRDRIEAFVDGGGRLAIFSGNTAFWKVRFENDGSTFVCHKWKGFEVDPATAVDPQAATHLWSHRTFDRPEASITGLSFLFGGYHRLGNCVARGQGGYTVYDEHHWTLQGCDLFYGDVIGADLPLLGYENDGCRFAFADDGRLTPISELGVPENLEIIAVAPVAFGEEPDRGYAPLIPPENLDIIARDVFGDDSPALRRRLIRGHAAMAAFKRGKGEVFNGGTTEWAHALVAHDPFVERITRNVLKRFGAY
jgi:hypothetical protein